MIAGRSTASRSIVMHRGIIGESKGDFDAIGLEAFGRELMGRDFAPGRTCPGGRYVLDANQGVDGGRKKRIGEAVQADTAVYDGRSTLGAASSWGCTTTRFCRAMAPPHAFEKSFRPCR